MIIDRKFVIGLALAGSLGAVATALCAPDDDQKPADGHVDLEREMKSMNQAFKVIRKQVSDPSKNAATIKLVLDLEQHTLTAKSAVPDVATTMPSADANAQKLNDYQAMMGNVLRQELDLEDELRVNQNDKAAATVDSLRGLESSGHEQFRPKEN